MKHFLLVIFFFNFQAVAQTQKPVVISGFDDVLRQAENTGLMKAAAKILEKDKTFAGMPELYQVLTSDEKTEIKFTLVSAISKWFQGRIEGFLSETHYPVAHLYLRNWLTEWSIDNFKVERLERVLSKNPGRRFIVIFDNSEPSLEIAELINNKYASKIGPVYLRETIFRKPRAGTVNFITALDIALSEYKLGRLSQAEVEKVGQAILNEKNDELVLPSYAYCPTNYDPCGNTGAEVAKTCDAVKMKIVDLCKTRKTD